MSVGTQKRLVAVQCPKCEFRFRVGAEFAGKSGACPISACDGIYHVPLAQQNTSKNVNATKPSLPRQKKVSDTQGGTAPSHPGFSQASVRGFWTRGLTALSVVLLVTVAAAAYRVAQSEFHSDETSETDVVESAESNVVQLNSPTADTKIEVRQTPVATPSTEKPEDVTKVKTDPFDENVRPFLKKYCIECHGGKFERAGLSLTEFTNKSKTRKSRATWEHILEMLEVPAMPPDDYAAQPSDAERTKVISWIDKTFFHVDCQLVNDPGRVTIRRLNRNEYNNTIRDLVGIDFEPAKDFPSDDVGYGFDNIGDVLSLPPLLMEKYLDAAEKISEAAIFVGDPGELSAQRFVGDAMQSKTASPERDGSFRTLASSGNVSAEFDLRLGGDYRIRVEASADQAGGELARMEFRINGKKIASHEIKGNRVPAMYESSLVVGGEGPVAPDKHRIEVWFVNDYYNAKAKDRKDRDRNLLVRSIELQGPLGASFIEYPQPHQRIMIAEPSDKKTSQQAAREILLAFANRAFRRPVAPHEVDRMVEVVTLALEQGEPFAQGIRYGIQAILVSPQFLFRLEADLDPNDPNKSHSIQQYELASRLSYFIWSSMPDDELFRLAGEGKLHEPAVLAQQVRRMLTDPKSDALVTNFGGQWLNLGLLDDAAPNPKVFPEFNEELRKDMKRETELFFAEIVRDNRSILDFLDGDFSYWNEKLALHYGIAGVRGDEFRRVKLSGGQRAGVLTQASILTLTSDPTKTAPVKRGKWILENILGTPPPPPPPNVPELAEVKKTNPNATLREQLEIHLLNPTCASCHKVMDPIGLGFENFDAIGRWRTKDGKHDVDPAGTLPSGEGFNGPAELIGILKTREEQFSRHLARSMLTYALGRGLEYYDKCAVDKVVAAIKNNGYKFSSLVTEIVRSDPFLMRRGDEGEK